VACVLLLAAACSSTGPATTQSPPTEPFRPRIYAALGDSYAAGEGLAPFEADSGPCHRSASAYPRLLAAQQGSSLDFTPCTGATIADLDAQLASVDPLSDLVTVTIGGNDVGFAAVVGDCVIGAEACSRLEPEVTASLGRLGPALESAYGRIRARAPKARLVVVGYPQVVAEPATAGFDSCAAVATPLPNRRITGDDARWLRVQGAKLSEVIRLAATTAGATYVDVQRKFAGHEACTAAPWLSGVVLGDLRASFHPTQTGQAELAGLVARALA